MDFVARAFVIENGRTVLDGTRDGLLSDPDFTSKFLGLE
jgi:branched-chain amino acid transport system ATP-binding protein